MKRPLEACLMTLATLIALASPSFATVKTVVLGSTFAAAPPGGSPGSIAASSADHFVGSGAWLKTSVSPKFEMYIDPAATFGSSFTIGQIASVTYHTRNNGNPSGIDFYMVFYTTPFAGGDASWYGRRVTSEPYYSNNYAPSTTAWNTWTTAAGPNQLTLYDINHNGGSFGFYGAPTLANLQGGPFTWSTWPGAPAGSDATPFNYGAQTVGLLSFQTGSGNPSFTGYLDGITINLTNGDQYNLDLENTPDNAINAAPPATCITAAHPCVTVPVNIARTSLTGVRAFSVTVQVSSQLDLCTGSTADITEGTYLSNVGGTHYEVISNGGGSYTIDGTILGATPGATAASGNLFNLSLKKTGADGVGTVTVTSALLRDPDNVAVLATAGASASVTIDYTNPVAVSGLTATQVKTGNDGDGTTKVALAFTAPGDAASVEVYRAPFGHYPEYDDAGGAVPATPAYPPAGPWALTGVTASGQSDETTARDFWYYVAFAKDACGNVSAVSNKTGGTLNYHLGDVVDPANPLSVGDNHVDGSDISRLGSHYGITLVLNDPYNYLDVGPTTNNSVNARPTTDNKVNFEDLVLFAINYSVVSAPQFAAGLVAADQDAIALDVPALPAVGGTFAVSLRMKGAGDVQAASVKLAYDAAVVEPVSVAAGSLLQAQGRGSVVLSPEPGTIDFALLGAGAGVTGEGEAAQMMFRVKSAGAAGLAVAGVNARDVQNRTLTMGTPAVVPGAGAPARTEMSAAYPNPFGHNATVQLSLAREAGVKLTIYDLIGRRVRTLINGVQPAGVRVLTWDGRNDAGVRLSAGVYVMRLETEGVSQSRRLQFVP